MKRAFNITINPLLLELITTHCCENNLSRSKYITQLIAKDLEIPLNSSGDVDETQFNEYLVKSIDKKIEELQLERMRILGAGGFL